VVCLLPGVCWLVVLCWRVCCAGTASPRISTLSLHDALPISPHRSGRRFRNWGAVRPGGVHPPGQRPVGFSRTASGQSVPSGLRGDRKSTRLNSSHVTISYAVFCLKKKNKTTQVADATRRKLG